MDSFILFGAALWFWVAFGALLIALLCAEGYESGTTASISFVAFLALLHFKGDLAGLVGKYVSWYSVVLYLVIGFVYCVWRFYLMGKKHGIKVMKVMEAYANKKKLTIPLDDEQLKEFQQSEKHSIAPPSTSEKVNKVIRWWLNWFASLIWWVLSDALRNFGKWLYRAFSGILEKAFNSGQTSAKKSYAKNPALYEDDDR